ncbi:filamentous hemagglutinin N-terminal domain-containing protein [Nostoc favosum]|uniref:Filamentous hemagglutinin N-terminal domain-containing protein n=1 Tax=Nostoc favosum CHAB5714 TaxID=2780399 RepID=A0ABS8I967_9NOSO|nr:filamentous hemagglutinin N-terminal domain-containing protein [Nostoc favosum]MCC5600729.1 filamentous hemagglutinin N-terminal domain-containing protein [Nostoc favosum CHAB5714]
MEILRFGVAGLLGCVGALAVSIHPTFAQLTPDNTLGIERSQVVPIDKDNDRIGGGAARGINLFHSFQDFNVGVGRGVYFANPEGITNIFSRVTGGNSSNIFGTLGVSGNANLFLLNPNGIVFGKNAQLDIQGSFLWTTANSLVFANGVEFSATNPQAPPLLAINVPIGLQFGSQPGSITSQAVIRNSQGNAVGGLSVGSGSTLALMGGEIALDDSYLSTQNGQVKLGAVGGDTTVGLNVNGSSLGFKFPENFGRAAINLTNGRIFATGGNSAIELFGGKIGLNGNRSYLFSLNGGSIVVDATQLNLDNGAGIGSATSGAAKGGDIQIQASDAVTFANNSRIFSQSRANATGAGGDITLNIADLLLLRRGGLISTTAGRSQAGGDGGNININSKFIVAIPEENSDISANAYSGTGGNVQINSQGIFGIESRPKPTEKSDITASSELGVSGVIKINAPDTSSIQNSFTELSANVMDTDALIANSCISRSPKQEGTFFITGSGGLRNSPGDELISIYSTGEVRSVNDKTSRTWKKGDRIVEPQGVYRLADGRLVLSRECQL